MIKTYSVTLYVGEQCVAEATADAWNIDEAQKLVERHYNVKATSAVIVRL